MMINKTDQEVENMICSMMKFECYPSRYKFRRLAMLQLVWDHGEICMNCGSGENIEIDHIKPESLYPELALDYENIQLLCRRCNASKGNRHETSYIPKSQSREDYFAELLSNLKES